jgi:hypothetical protein
MSLLPPGIGDDEPEPSLLSFSGLEGGGSADGGAAGDPAASLGAVRGAAGVAGGSFWWSQAASAQSTLRPKALLALVMATPSKGVGPPERTET